MIQLLKLLGTVLGLPVYHIYLSGICIPAFDKDTPPTFFIHLYSVPMLDRSSVYQRASTVPIPVANGSSGWTPKTER